MATRVKVKQPIPVGPFRAEELERLLAEGPAPRDAARVVAPLRELIDSTHWEYSLDGFAAFLSPAFGAAYRLPIHVPERTVVADTFHVKPLIPFLHANRRYLVLAVSENDRSEEHTSELQSPCN